MLGYGDATLLGILEGLTEFIPVSSTGHMILLGNVLGVTDDEAKLFEIIIQLGAILAVVVLYSKRFMNLFDFSAGRAFTGWDGIVKLGVASLPALALGFLLHDVIDDYLMESPRTVACALIVGAIFMFIVERTIRPRRVEAVEDLSLKSCFAVGCFQSLALWPGMSRSGSTIVGAMFLGIKREVAAELSFLMAVPVMIAAVGFSVLKKWKLLLNVDPGVFAWGFLVSFVVAVLAIRFFIGIVQRYSLEPFAVYRIALGLIVLALAY